MQLLNLDKKYYCGIDLHGKTMYTSVMDKSGALLFHKNLPNSMPALLEPIGPFRHDIAVGVESTFNWYWLADGCQKESIPFYLGHALYMKAVHGGKTKNDSLDSRHITDQTIAGVGEILAYTLLYEIHTISRFPSPQAFSSYCRLVKPERSSGGKSVGSGNGKIGNPHLKWAFTQIVIHAQLYSPKMRRYYERMKQKHGPAKSKSIMGHKYAVAVYHMLKNKKEFDENKFIGG